MTASATVSTIARPRSPFNFEATICVVMTRKLPPKTYGALNEASEVMNVSSAAPVRTGPRRGSVTRRAVRARPDPRLAAASR